MPILHQNELESLLNEAVSRLRDTLAPAAIYLYGSYVYGKPRAHSDLDLLVILEQSDSTPFERDAAAYRALSGLGVPKDVQVYTRGEFEQRARLPVSFERTVKTKGRLLYAA
mgnify:FL=1